MIKRSFGQLLAWCKDVVLASFQPQPPKLGGCKGATDVGKRAAHGGPLLVQVELEVQAEVQHGPAVLSSFSFSVHSM